MDPTRLAVLIPTRGTNRYTNVLRLHAALNRTCISAPVIHYVVHESEYAAGGVGSFPVPTRLIFNPGDSLVSSINHGVAWLDHQYPDLAAVAVLNDDHLPRTAGWDTQFLQTLAQLGGGFVWGNDGVHGSSLATAMCASMSVYRTLGWLALPSLHHLYLDNVWTDLAMATRYGYLPDVMIEHLHPTVSSAARDGTYQVGSMAPGRDEDDGDLYRMWSRSTAMPQDVVRLRRHWDMD